MRKHGNPIRITIMGGKARDTRYTFAKINLSLVRLCVAHGDSYVIVYIHFKISIVNLRLTDTMRSSGVGRKSIWKIRNIQISPIKIINIS